MEAFVVNTAEPTAHKKRGGSKEWLLWLSIPLVGLACLLWWLSRGEPKHTTEIALTNTCLKEGVVRADSFMPFTAPDTQMCVVDLYQAGGASEYGLDKVSDRNISPCERYAIERAGQIWRKSRNFYTWEGAPDGKWMGFIECSKSELSVFSVGETGYFVEVDAPNIGQAIPIVGRGLACVRADTRFRVIIEEARNGIARSCVIRLKP
jgi:hypothetical protein